MSYTVKYFFEEDADRIDGFLIEDVAHAYDDCRVKSIESDVKIDIDNLQDDSIISFCDIELVCDTIETLDLIVAQIEKKFGIVPYKYSYGDSL